MEVTRRQVDDVVILDLEGKLTIGKGDVILRGAFVDELDVGQRKLVVNLDKVKVIDSSGLGELIRCKVTASEKEGQAPARQLEGAQAHHHGPAGWGLRDVRRRGNGDRLVFLKVTTSTDKTNNANK